MKGISVKHPVKLSEFLSVCLQLSEHAGNFIKQVHNSGNYGSNRKETTDIGLDDLFTVADITVQKNIEFNIKELFPHVSIVSEEDPVNTKHIKPTLMPDQISLNTVSESMLVNAFRGRREKLKAYIDSEHGHGTC